MTSIIVSDPFWASNPLILIRSDRIIEFIITKDMELSEKLNALVRFFIYLSIILTVYTGVPLYLLLALITMMLSTIVYYSDNSSKNIEKYHTEITKKYKTPTLNNPLMNSSVLDLSSDRKPAIPYSGETIRSDKVKEDIDKKLKYNLYENFGDVYNTMQSQRQFYTMPGEFTANDANGEFKEFLYGNLKSNKENSYENQIYEPLGRGNSLAI